MMDFGIWLQEQLNERGITQADEDALDLAIFEKINPIK
jgi:hypothetical protein